jgi:hypothetical protein
MSPDVWEDFRKAKLTGRHLVEYCYDLAFLTSHLAPGFSADIAKLVKELYAAPPYYKLLAI